MVFDPPAASFHRLVEVYYAVLRTIIGLETQISGKGESRSNHSNHKRGDTIPPFGSSI